MRGELSSGVLPWENEQQYTYSVLLPFKMLLAQEPVTVAFKGFFSV